MDDLLPRADISGQITGELIGKLGSATWKERKEALDAVEGILAAAGGRIQPGVRSRGEATGRGHGERPQGQERVQPSMHYLVCPGTMWAIL